MARLHRHSCTRRRPVRAPCCEPDTPQAPARRRRPAGPPRCAGRTSADYCCSFHRSRPQRSACARRDRAGRTALDRGSSRPAPLPCPRCWPPASNANARAPTTSTPTAIATTIRNERRRARRSASARESPRLRLLMLGFRPIRRRSLLLPRPRCLTCRRRGEDERSVPPPRASSCRPRPLLPRDPPRSHLSAAPSTAV